MHAIAWLSRVQLEDSFMTKDKIEIYFGANTMQKHFSLSSSLERKKNEWKRFFYLFWEIGDRLSNRREYNQSC